MRRREFLKALGVAAAAGPAVIACGHTGPGSKPVLPEPEFHGGLREDILDLYGSLDGMAGTMERTIFYGNPDLPEETFMGLKMRYSEPMPILDDIDMRPGAINWVPETPLPVGRWRRLG